MRAEDVDALLEAPLKQLDPRREAPFPRAESKSNSSKYDQAPSSSVYSKDNTTNASGRHREDMRNERDDRNYKGIINPCNRKDCDYERHRRPSKNSDTDYHSYRSDKSHERSRSRDNRRYRDNENDNDDEYYRSRKYDDKRSELDRRSDEAKPKRRASYSRSPPIRPAVRLDTIVTSTIPADKRTVFVRQIGQRVGEREVREVCEKAGRVMSVRLVLDRVTRRHKGIAYVEFAEEDALPRAIALTGTRLANIPLIFELTDAEKNRIAAEASEQQRKNKIVDEQQKSLLCRVVIEQLHTTANEEDVKRFFAGCGPILSVTVSRAQETAQVDFKYSGDAKRAVESLDRHILLARQVHLRIVSINQNILPRETHSARQNASSALLEEADEYSLTPEKRAELMLKLARSATSFPSSHLVLSNLPVDNPREVEDEIRSECNRFGSVLGVNFRGDSAQIAFKSSEAASAAQKALDNRWFSGKLLHARLE